MTLHYTVHLKLAVPDFLTEPWHGEFDAAMESIDRVLYDAVIAQNTALWLNSHVYVPGNLVISPDNGSLYSCAVGHTSSPLPQTFTQEQIDHPTFWVSFAPTLATQVEAEAGVENTHYMSALRTKQAISAQIGSGFVLRTGDTMTGDLFLTYANPLIKFIRSAGTIGGMYGYNVASSPRWGVLVGNDDTESVGNLGSNFEIRRHDDSGAILASPLRINRATGAVMAHGIPFNVRRYPSGGTYPSVPAAKVGVKVLCCVKGGGGGGGGSNNAGRWGGGGGEGATSWLLTTAGALSGQTVTVGAAGGSAPANSTAGGGAGGTSSVGALVSASGGAGGQPIPGGSAAGAGGVNTIGDFFEYGAAGLAGADLASTVGIPATGGGRGGAVVGGSPAPANSGAGGGGGHTTYASGAGGTGFVYFIEFGDIS